jgi:hypothetical protein
MFKNILKVNDSIWMIYVVTMLFMIFSPHIFFAKSTDYYKSIGLLYFIISFILYNDIRKRTDFSDNLKKYLLYGFLATFLFTLFISNPTEDLSMFSHPISFFIYQVIVIGLSETYIMIGLAEKLKNIPLTVIIMGFLHTTAYMSILGDFTFNASLFFAIFISIISFSLFFVIWKYTKDPFIVALIHGLLNIYIMGGL